MPVSAELTDFIQRALQQGHARCDVKTELRRAGWADTEADAALDAWQDGALCGPVPRPVRSAAALDALFYALLFLGFGMIAGNLLTLAFGQLTFWLPETGDTFRSGATRSLRWSMAAVIVFAPAFMWLDRRDARHCSADPARRHGTIRRWLTSLALFAAVACLLGNALFVIFTWLDGQMTLRFMAKAAVVAALSGIVLGYFRQDLASPMLAGNRVAAWSLTLPTVLVLVLSFMTIGGPAQGQMERRDHWRVSDMNILAGNILRCDGVDMENLPAALDPMDCARNPARLTGFAPQITYTRLSATAFKLCSEIEAPRTITAHDMTIDGNIACQTSGSF